MLLHPFLLCWLHVGHYVWKTLEVLSDAVFSRLSSDVDLLWGQSSVFTQGLSHLRLGGPCKLSLSSLHPPSQHHPPTRPQGGALQRLRLEAWGASQGPSFSAGPESHRPPPEDHEVIDTERPASLGRVLGTFSVPNFSWRVWSLPSELTCQACAHIFVFPARGTVQSCVSQSPLLDFPLPFLRRVSFVQMPPGRSGLSVSSSLTGLPFCLRSWIVAA